MYCFFGTTTFSILETTEWSVVGIFSSKIATYQLMLSARVSFWLRNLNIHLINLMKSSRVIKRDRDRERKYTEKGRVVWLSFGIGWHFTIFEHFFSILSRFMLAPDTKLYNLPRSIGFDFDLRINIECLSFLADHKMFRLNIIPMM